MRETAYQPLSRRKAVMPRLPITAGLQTKRYLFLFRKKLAIRVFLLAKATTAGTRFAVVVGRLMSKSIFLPYMTLQNVSFATRKKRHGPIGRYLYPPEKEFPFLVKHEYVYRCKLPVDIVSRTLLLVSVYKKARLANRFDCTPACVPPPPVVQTTLMDISFVNKLPNRA